MFTLTEEQITKAINWWKQAVEKPKFDNGDPSTNGGMAMLLGMLLASESEPDNSSKYAAFADELRARLSDPSYNPGWGLHVDYHPDFLLADAAKAAGISTNLFPWKTSMYFREDGSVQVSHGYGAPVVNL